MVSTFDSFQQSGVGGVFIQSPLGARGWLGSDLTPTACCSDGSPATVQVTIADVTICPPCADSNWVQALLAASIGTHTLTKLSDCYWRKDLDVVGFPPSQIEVRFEYPSGKTAFKRNKMILMK